MQKKQSESKQSLWPVIMIAWILPLIVAVSINNPTATESFVYYFVNDSDFFYYGKGLVFCLIVLLLIGDVVRKQETEHVYQRLQNPLVFPIGIMLLLVVLSVIFSADMSLSSRGGLRHFEGFWVMSGYLLLPPLVSFYLSSDSLLMKSYTLLAWSTIPVSAIGVLQHFGFNLLNTTAYKTLLLLSYDLAIRTPDVIPSWTGATSTLGNPNFVGSYCAMTVPLTLGYFMIVNDHKIRFSKAIPYLFSSALLLASESSAGITGAFAGTAVLLFSPLSGTMPPRIIGLFCGIPGCISLLMQLNPHTALSSETAVGAVITSFILWLLIQLKTMMQKKMSPGHLFLLIHGALLIVFFVVSALIFITPPNDVQKIHRIEGSLGVLTLEKSTDTIRFFMKEDHLCVEVQDPHGIRYYTPQKDAFTVSTPHFGVLHFFLKTSPTQTRLFASDFKTTFVFEPSQVRAEILERLYPITTVKQIPCLSPYERLGSSRIYIWSRTLPLISQRIFIGSGPDTFAVSFPQNDLLGRINNGLDNRLIVDKAHNMYLQYAVNFGLIFVIAFLSILTLACRQCLKYCSVQQSTSSFIAYSALIGYSTAGIFNDSIPSTAPLFWLLIGFLWAAECKNKDALSEEMRL